jgi:acid phosphatase family membrane protein YuiD
MKRTLILIMINTIFSKAINEHHIIGSTCSMGYGPDSKGFIWIYQIRKRWQVTCNMEDHLGGRYASVHSSVITSVAITILHSTGFESAIFGLAAVMSLIVIYDREGCIPSTIHSRRGIGLCSRDSARSCIKGPCRAQAG